MYFRKLLSEGNYDDVYKNWRAFSQYYPHKNTQQVPVHILLQ